MDPPRSVRARQRALELLRFLQSGEFNRQAPQTEGDEIRRILTWLSAGEIEVPLEDQWPLLHDMVALTMANRIRVLRINPKLADTYNLSFVLLGTYNPLFADVGDREVDKATARMIGLLAPGLLPIVPPQFASFASGFVGAGGAPVQRIELKLPTEELASAVAVGVERAFEKYGTAPPTAPPRPHRVRTVEEVPPPPPPPRPEYVPPPAAPPPPPPAPAVAYPTLLPPTVVPPPAPFTPEQLVQEAEGAPVTAPEDVYIQRVEERWRPRYLEEVVGNPLLIRLMQGWVSTNNFPSCVLMYGVPGIGKSTAAAAMVRSYFRRQGQIQKNPALGARDVPIREMAVFYGSNDVGPGPNQLPPSEFVSTRVIPAMKTQPIGFTRVLRFIVLDDIIDKLSVAAQEALRTPLEHTRSIIIWTTNDISKVIPAIRSRCTKGLLEFKPPTVYEISARLQKIAKAEGWDFADLEQVTDDIARQSERDMRQAIGLLERAWLIRSATEE